MPVTGHDGDLVGCKVMVIMLAFVRFRAVKGPSPRSRLEPSQSGTSYLNPHQRDTHAAQPENKGDIPLVVGVRRALCRLRREVKVWE